MKSRRAEVVQLLRRLQHAGFSIERTACGHWRIRDAQGTWIKTAGSTPHRAEVSGLLRLVKRAEQKEVDHG
jgi:hypothetical protein